MFKTNAYSAILDQNKDAKYVDHKNCRMGKWYTGEGAERFANNQSFKALDIPHSKVHNAVKKNFVYIQENSVLKYENPQHIVKNFKEMEVASGELFVLLDTMIKE
ncbi:CZB domain-containing protein [Sulfurimonas sp.]|nr:CZB domain-containing protein [Sulfurimonas sp.]